MAKIGVLEESEQMGLPLPGKRENNSRRRRPARGKAFQVKKMPRKFLALLDTLYPYPEWGKRPKTRAECEKMPRPCPYVSCRYHRFVDVDSEKKGSQIKFNFPDIIDYENMDEEKFKDTCILDLAAEGPRTLDEIGELLNLTRERVRQIEARAIRRLYNNEEFRDILKKMKVI